METVLLAHLPQRNLEEEFRPWLRKLPQISRKASHCGLCFGSLHLVDPELPGCRATIPPDGFRDCVFLAADDPRLAVVTPVGTVEMWDLSAGFGFGPSYDSSQRGIKSESGGGVLGGRPSVRIPVTIKGTTPGTEFCRMCRIDGSDLIVSTSETHLHFWSARNLQEVCSYRQQQELALVEEEEEANDDGGSSGGDDEEEQLLSIPCTDEVMTSPQGTNDGVLDLGLVGPRSQGRLLVHTNERDGRRDAVIFDTEKMVVAQTLVDRVRSNESCRRGHFIPFPSYSCLIAVSRGIGLQMWTYRQNTHTGIDSILASRSVASMDFGDACRGDDNTLVAYRRVQSRSFNCPSIFAYDVRESSHPLWESSLGSETKGVKSISPIDSGRFALLTTRRVVLSSHNESQVVEVDLKTLKIRQISHTCFHSYVRSDFGAMKALQTNVLTKRDAGSYAEERMLFLIDLNIFSLVKGPFGLRLSGIAWALFD